MKSTKLKKREIVISDIKRLRQIRDALNKTKNRKKLERIANILEV